METMLIRFTHGNICKGQQILVTTELEYFNYMWVEINLKFTGADEIKPRERFKFHT